MRNSPSLNIERTAKLLSEIQERLPNATPAAIATLYNNLYADTLSGYGLTIEKYMESRPWDECFPSSTPIAISLTDTRPIADIRVGDTVLAFDPAADLGRGALVPRKVARLYRNTTDEWVKLAWVEGGETKELVATPGHHFLDRFGNFPTIEEMLENGRATVVLASGELTEVSAERIAYSAEAAHLFEQAQVAGMIAGNAALKPAAIDAWQTYNFEVEDLHTYVAGGVRVHNRSGFLGKVGNTIDAALDNLFGGNDGDGSDVLAGGTGRDVMHGGAGHDVIYADAQDVFFVNGVAQITGGEGYDRLILE